MVANSVARLIGMTVGDMGRHPVRVPTNAQFAKRTCSLAPTHQQVAKSIGHFSYATFPRLFG